MQMGIIPIPRHFRSRERKFQETKVPWSESSRERKFHLWKIRGNESSIIPLHPVVYLERITTINAFKPAGSKPVIWSSPRTVVGLLALSVHPRGSAGKAPAAATRRTGVIHQTVLLDQHMLQQRKIRHSKCRTFAASAEFPPFEKVLDPWKFRRYTA